MAIHCHPNHEMRSPNLRKGVWPRHKARKPRVGLSRSPRRPHSGNPWWDEIWALDEMLSINRKANGQAYLFVGNREIFYIQGVGTVSDASIDARQHSKYTCY